MARKRAKRKPTRKRSQKRVSQRGTPPADQPIRFKVVDVWRKGGAFSRAGVKGATRTRHMAQISPTGAILDMLQLMTRRHVAKATVPGAVEASEGLITRALGQTNALTSSKGAKHLHVRVSYRRPDGRRESFILDHKTEDAAGKGWSTKDINHLMVGSIIQGLRQRGFRTRYQIQTVDWTKVRTIKRRTTSGGVLDVAGRTQVARRQEVNDVQITVISEK